MRTYYHAATIILLLLVTSCISAKTPSDDFNSGLRDAFSTIYLSHYGLNYPPNEKALSAAINHHDRASLKTFNLVMDAKQYIRDKIRLDPDRALETTLAYILNADSIDPTTIKDKNPDNFPREQFAVTGAVIALYFFNTEEQDQIIFARMKMASPIILNKLFGGDFEWLYNRPNPERWIALVESIPESTLPILHKKWLQAKFETKMVDKFGIMLESPLAQGK